MNQNSKIYVAGHEGMIGSLLLEELIYRGYKNVITKEFEQLDLRDQSMTTEFIQKSQLEYVFLIAGKVGGIQANIKSPADFLYDNLMISSNVIEASRLVGVKKLLFLGSSCIYPRLCEQPMKEEYLLTGGLEPTNEGYAIGKIAGVKLCEYYNKQYGCNFISAIPPNIYGPRDNFSLTDSHVISALIRKIHYAKVNGENSIEIWGTGSARREFLFNSDLVDGLIFLMINYSEKEHINIGSGNDISIKELAELIKKIIGYKGEFFWDESKPDGMPKKLMDSSKINALGWFPKTSLRNGLQRTYNWYKENKI
ncbi:MAG: GDP-L-fucose synthase [Bacteroidetes bacterium]|nr:GDP-L-fucose synthase [Bacteroidota bacterium]